jgi:hypothetical protein
MREKEVVDPAPLPALQLNWMEDKSETAVREVGAGGARSRVRKWATSESICPLEFRALR